MNTPTPTKPAPVEPASWVATEGRGKVNPRTVIKSSAGELICVIESGAKRRDIDLMLRAVNYHDRLRNMLSTLVRQYGDAIMFNGLADWNEARQLVQELEKE